MLAFVCEKWSRQTSWSPSPQSEHNYGKKLTTGIKYESFQHNYAFIGKTLPSGHGKTCKILHILVLQVQTLHLPLWVAKDRTLCNQGQLYGKNNR